MIADIEVGDWATVRRVIDAVRVGRGSRRMCGAFERLTRGHRTVSEAVHAAVNRPRYIRGWPSTSYLDYLIYGLWAQLGYPGTVLPYTTAQNEREVTAAAIRLLRIAMERYDG